MLPTAVILMLAADGNYYPFRSLLDSGAQSTLVTENCVQKLGLKRTYDKPLLSGIGNSNVSYTRGKVSIKIKSRNTDKSIKVSALCLKRLTQLQPALKVENNDLAFFTTLNLADSHYNCPNHVDVIIGADVLPQCLLGEQINHPKGSMTAINTIFGWVIFGSTSILQHNRITIAHTSIDITSQLRKFWEIEEIQLSDINKLSDEEQQAEDYFKKTVTRAADGKYIVRLPFKTQQVQFGDSKQQAIKRLSNMEIKFNKDMSLKTNYNAFMEEYIELNHMQQMPQSTNGKYYLPHHAVYKSESTTTKLRVVFDGSAKTSNKTSLNEQLLVGATIQNDIVTILLQFRKYQIGMSADIEKMYRQIWIHPDDRAYQCIVWRRDQNQNIETFQLQTITYGTSAAPFLAVRTLKQIAEDNQQVPASRFIIENFYVDDFLASMPNSTSSIQLRKDLCQILTDSGMRLRKWCSNSTEVLDTIPIEDRETSAETNIDDTQTIKTLGIYWETTSDIFKYHVNLPNLCHQITKREVLSIISRVYDPLGWLSPVVITFKIFMQKLWLKGVEWDSALPDDLQTQWNVIYNNLKYIHQIQIPRWLGYSNELQTELHVFADSSELAYAAAVYLKITYDNGQVMTRLVSAKSKVAPVKQVTLPRLELCGCQLATRLLLKVKKALDIKNIQLHGWTDSSIVLAWLAEHPRRWKSFIANRTSDIISVLPRANWHHIPSAENPADTATRGVTPHELKTKKLWWSGPSILQTQQYNTSNGNIIQNTDLEWRKTEILHFTCDAQNLFNRYSNWSQLIRTTAYIFRFINNCKNNIKRKDSLGVIELQAAQNKLIKRSQELWFKKEIQILKADKQLPQQHKLAALTPFIDDQEIMRVGGRLRNANISYDQMHPVILHKECSLTNLLVKHYHLKHLHAGSRQLQYLIGLRYWIPSVIHLIKRVVYKCTTCIRYRHNQYQQQMADIPKQRLQACSAFENSGIDFAGPFSIRSWRGRGSKTYKCWGAVFVCLVTKAIHLELVTELTTDAFLAALRRFVSRRGKPQRIYSDNGTNFVGCNRELKELLQFMLQQATQDTIERQTAELGIQWYFSPPAGPNFGGMWEAGVKSLKYHLRRTLGNSIVTYEEMNTVLCQIEACLNSRPLCSKFQGDVDPLTPAHFLIFKAMDSVADRDLTKQISVD